MEIIEDLNGPLSEERERDKRVLDLLRKGRERQEKYALENIQKKRGKKNGGLMRK